MDIFIEKFNKWAENSIVDEVIILSIVIALVEAIAQNLIKTSGDDNKPKLLFGVSFYIVVGFLLHHAYHKFDLSKVNVTWSCLSIILATFLGYFIYNEHLTWKSIVAVFFALLAILFASF